MAAILLMIILDAISKMNTGQFFVDVYWLMPVEMPVNFQSDAIIITPDFEISWD